MTTFHLLKPIILHWDYSLLSVVMGGTDEDRWHFDKCILNNSSKFSYPSLRQNQKCTMDYSSCKKRELKSSSQSSKKCFQFE